MDSIPHLCADAWWIHERLGPFLYEHHVAGARRYVRVRSQTTSGQLLDCRLKRLFGNEWGVVQPGVH